MRALAFFAAGIVVGIVMMQPGTAQADHPPKLNHVGINVKNFDEAVNFYTKTMGFREAFSFREPDGRPFLTYLQISRETFLELQPAGPDRPAGVSHIGLQVDNLKASMATLGSRGVQLEQPRTGRTGGPLTNATGPEGLRIELLQFDPGTSQRKAMDAWK